MSTPRTSTDPGGGRRSWRPRPPQGAGRARRAEGDRDERRARRSGADGGEPTRSALLARCRREGARAARRRVFDPWVLSTEGMLPRLASLAAERDRVRQGLLRRAANERGAAELTAGRARADADAAQAAARLTAAERAEHEAQLGVTRQQLDRLARETASRGEAREAVTRWLEERRGRGAAQPPPPAGNGTAPGATGEAPDAERAAADGPRATHGSHATDGPRAGHGVDGRRPSAARDGDTTLDPDADASPAAGSTPAPADGPTPGNAPTPVQWEGESRAGLSRRGTLALLACLTLVELPIYWTAFRRLHGVGDASSNLLTATFTFAVGAVMIVVPHVLGRLLRGLPATGAPRLLALPGIALLLTWVYACWVLGNLRASLLAEVREPYLADPGEAAYLSPDERRGTSVLQDLDIGERTMSLMFVALLLLSGGVAFLLGLSLAHPYLAAYRGAFDARRRLAAAEHASLAAARRAAERAGTRPAEEAARRDALDAALREVDDLYEAAAHAYVDGVASAARDPAVTEAAMRLSGTWPLLPRPATTA